MDQKRVFTGSIKKRTKVSREHCTVAPDVTTGMEAAMLQVTVNDARISCVVTSTLEGETGQGMAST